MRILVISDIHSNSVALEAIREPFDICFCLGDLVDYGPDPAGCLRWGSALGASCVRAIGATESVFNRPEAEQFMRQHELKIEKV